MIFTTCNAYECDGWCLLFSFLFYSHLLCYWAWVTCVVGTYTPLYSDCSSSSYILYTRSRLCAKIAWPEGVVHTTNDGWDVYGAEYYTVAKKKEIILKNSCAIFYSIALYIFTSILMISFFFTVIQLKIIIIYIT